MGPYARDEFTAREVMLQRRQGQAKKTPSACTRPAPVHAPGVRVGLDTELVDTFVVGLGNALVLSGWCYHPQCRIRTLNIIADGIAHPVHMHGILRPDIQEKA